MIIFAAAAVYFVYEFFKMKSFGNRKKSIRYLCTRLIIIILLFLSASDFGIKLKNIDNTTIFLVDESLSVSTYKKQIEEYINYEIQKKSRGDKYAVIGFSEEAAVEVPLTYKKQTVKLSLSEKNNFTNLENAVCYAADYFPENNNKRLVVITDENENKGSIKSIKDKVQKENINILVKEVKNDDTNDVQLSEMDVPHNINKNGCAPVKTILSSNYKGTGSICIYMNDKKVKTMQVNVVPGENDFDFTLQPDNSEKMILKGEINFPEDKNGENNTSFAEVKVKSEPKVLVIYDKKEDAINIDKLLDNLNIKKEDYLSNEVPGSINFLSDFTDIFLVNTEYKNLPQGFDDNLDKAVKYFGTGLITVGGENSFALGGYKGTKLESMLPVSCTMKNRNKQADTGLILMIDCSGSMNDESGGVKKIELAKKGAIEALKALEDEDYAGVLAFSDTLEWIVPYQKVQDKDKLINEVSKLEPKGGTLIIPGLKEAAETIKNSDVKIKHIILLTDGQAEKKGFDKYISEMKKYGITLSTVAVGQDCDKDVLNHLSQSLNGRQYYCEDFKEVPQILLKETCISEKKYLNNETFKPKKYSSELNKEGVLLPELHGYTGTGIKSGADTILESRTGDPVLAAWQYGLGKVCTWASDLSGKWSKDWIKWKGFNKYWSSVIDYVGKTASKGTIKIELEKNEADVKISAVSTKPDDKEDIECIVTEPHDIQKKVTMTSGKNGVYKGRFSLEVQGKYKVDVYKKEGAKVLDYDEKSIYLDYSPEYKLVKSQVKGLDMVIAGCSGKYLKSDENVFKEPIANRNISYVDLSYMLLPAAFLIFLFDIYIRMKR